MKLEYVLTPDQMENIINIMKHSTISRARLFQLMYYPGSFRQGEYAQFKEYLNLKEAILNQHIQDTLFTAYQNYSILYKDLKPNKTYNILFFHVVEFPSVVALIKYNSTIKTITKLLKRKKQIQLDDITISSQEKDFSMATHYFFLEENNNNIEEILMLIKLNLPDGYQLVKTDDELETR